MWNSFFVEILQIVNFIGIFMPRQKWLESDLRNIDDAKNSLPNYSKGVIYVVFDHIWHCLLDKLAQNLILLSLKNMFFTLFKKYRIFFFFKVENLHENCCFQWQHIYRTIQYELNFILDVKIYDSVHSSAAELIKQHRSQIRCSPCTTKYFWNKT